MSTMLIPLSGTDLQEFTPSEFKNADGEPFKDAPVFYFRTPTFAMRDKMAAILFQRGFIPATMNMSRAILIDGLYELYPEAEADDNATFLESFWTRQEVHEEITTAWQIREAERLFDIAMGVKNLPQEPVPTAPYTMREQARQGAIVSYVLENNERYRAYQARFMVQEEEEHEMIVRLFLDHWDNTDEVKAVRDVMDRLETDCIERLRQWLKDRAAPKAWDEIKRGILGMFGASGQLEKNSASPLDMNSSLNGSQTSSGDLENSDGSSTTSSTEPTQDTGSPRTSDASPNSRSGKRGSKAKASPRKKAGQTADPS